MQKGENLWGGPRGKRGENRGKQGGTKKRFNKFPGIAPPPFFFFFICFSHKTDVLSWSFDVLYLDSLMQFTSWREDGRTLFSFFFLFFFLPPDMFKLILMRRNSCVERKEGRKEERYSLDEKPRFGNPKHQ